MKQGNGQDAGGGRLRAKLAIWRTTGSAGNSNTAGSAGNLHTAGGPVIVDAQSLALYALAARAAATDVPILVSGPSGTGKEVMARYIHDHSRRATGPFLALNCAALPEAMVESLLFGHARGAFTGAAVAAAGLFRAASGGTLFLDELGELAPALQAKLLRAVEQREVLPLGEAAPVPVDVRIVAATNRNLMAEVENGRFRADLYWRLAAFPLALLPLASRPGDLLPLVARLLPAHPISEEALERLLAHGWPGNVRELAHVLQRAAILAGDNMITPDHLPALSLPPAGLPARLRAEEAQVLHAAIAVSAGRREAAARLGISERSLRYKLAALAGRPRGNRAMVLQ